MRLYRTLILITVVVSSFAGCLMAPIRPEITHLQGNLTEPSTTPGEAKLVLFNNSNKLLFGLDNTGRINAWLNSKAVGGPNIGEYIQLQVPKGKHELTLVHLDVLEFRSQHQIDVQDDLLFIELRATPVSNEIRLHKILPAENYLPKPFMQYVYE
jgi:hypothetical protein